MIMTRILVFNVNVTYLLTQSLTQSLTYFHSHELSHSLSHSLSLLMVQTLLLCFLRAALFNDSLHHIPILTGRKPNMKNHEVLRFQSLNI